MKDFLNYELLRINEDITLTIGSILFIILGFLLAKVINFVLLRILKAYFKKRAVDVGRSYTILQLLKYFIYVVILLSTLSIIGIKLTYLMAGSAALLVGVGIGLQQTFNDFFSGIILLVDGSVEVGDILHINNNYGKVKFIGLRASKIETRDGHNLIIPNSKLINNAVNNLTNKGNPIRFHVDVAVSYKSDIQLVEKILLDVIKPYNKFKMNFTPAVHLHTYGESSIDFKLYFYSKQVFLIDKHLSDIRKDIIHAFHKNNIEIPFPQRDLWIKKDENSSSIT